MAVAIQAIRGRRSEPVVNLGRVRQDHRHRFRVNGGNLGIRLSRQKSENVICRFAVLTLRTDVHCGSQMPAKKARGRSSLSANQMSPPSALLNSLNEVNGTTHRLSTRNHRPQWGDRTLRMFVVPGSRLLAPRSAGGVGAIIGLIVDED